jgi:exodeoxyribonuclease-5
MITLTEHQQEQLNSVKEALTTGDEAVLSGAAGTGKTTVLKQLQEQLKMPVIYLAPTGKAAVRVKEQSGTSCQTIHSALFSEVDELESEEGGKVELKFSEPKPPEGCYRGTLVVVDEASMVGEELARILRQQVIDIAQAKILWVGDHEQLPPVKSNWGADLQNPHGKLTEVHRQALGSPVLELATRIRTGCSDSFKKWNTPQAVKIERATVDGAVNWLSEGGDRTLLTFLNNTRKVANLSYRNKAGYPIGDLVKGETLLVTMNNHNLGLMNGETVMVEEIEENKELTKALNTRVKLVTIRRGHGSRTYPVTFYCFPEIFDQDTKAVPESKMVSEVRSRLYDAEVYEEIRQATGWDTHDIYSAREILRGKVLQCTYGYCLTVHKSQGSQWNEVGYISGGFFRKMKSSDPDYWKRLYYTAVTRTAEKYVEFEVGYIPKAEGIRKSYELSESVKNNNGQKLSMEQLRAVLINGGNFMMTSKRTKIQYAYSIQKSKDNTLSFVNCIYDTKACNDYIGVITSRGFKTTAKSKKNATDPAVKAFSWALNNANTKSPKLLEQADFHPHS